MEEFLYLGTLTAVWIIVALAANLVVGYTGMMSMGQAAYLGVGAYAREIGTSEAALRKSCVRVAGQSPTQLIHARMLIEAERQLRYTGMSITQIAYYLGFEDPAYFSRFFTKGMGASPRSFRRSTGTT